MSDQTPAIPIDQLTLLVILLVVLAWATGKLLPRITAGVPFLKPKVAKELLDAAPDKLILDVRMDSEFNGPDGHLPGADNLPLIELMGRVKQVGVRLEAYRDMPVLVVCKKGALSARAARVLRKGGLKHVFVLDGGLKAWKRKGFPLEGEAGSDA